MNDLPFDVTPQLLLSLPGLRLYALCAVILVVKMFAVGFYTAATRGRLKVALNPEDAAHLKSQLVDTEPPAVAHALRAHRNDLENIPPFLILALTAVLMGVPGLPLKVALVAFTAARVGHSIAYLRSMQPWRTIFFGLGSLSMFTVMVLMLIRVFTE